jgi:stress-induced morphogen
MPATKDDLLQKLLKNGISQENGYQILIKPLVMDNEHWEIKVKSEHFKNLSRIMQHRKIIDALENLATDVHAISIKTEVI